jgi:hypothetical protein
VTFEKFALTYSSALASVSNVMASVITADQASPVHTSRLPDGRPFGGRLVGASAVLRSEPMTYSAPCLQVMIPIELAFLVVDDD